MCFHWVLLNTHRDPDAGFIRHSQAVHSTTLEFDLQNLWTDFQHLRQLPSSSLWQTWAAQGGGLTVAHSLKGYSPCWWGSHACRQVKQQGVGRGEPWSSAGFLLCTQSRTSVHVMTSPFRVGPPTSANLSQVLIQRCAQRSVYRDGRKFCQVDNLS